jgi:hypothetical protein
MFVAAVVAKNLSGKGIVRVSLMENGSSMENTLPTIWEQISESPGKTIEFEGNSYVVVGEFPEQTWAYREIGNEFVEVLSQFCGCTVLDKCNIAVMKIIIAHWEGKL